MLALLPYGIALVLPLRLGAHWQLNSCGDKIVAVNVRTGNEKTACTGNFFSFGTE
jgi:hypothetical protein